MKEVAEFYRGQPGVVEPSGVLSTRQFPLSDLLPQQDFRHCDQATVPPLIKPLQPKSGHTGVGLPVLQHPM